MANLKTLQSTLVNIIFDFGNVLVRWEPVRSFLPYFGCDHKAFSYFWEHICDADLRNRIDAGEPQREVIAEYQARHPQYAKPLAMYFDNWEAGLPGEVPGMRDLVAQLKAQPHTHIYGLTNWSMETFPQSRERFEILQLIDNYIVSGDVKLIKPNPKIFELLMQRFNLKAEECLFIDDNPNNVQAAISLGMQGIVFRGCDDLRQHLTPLLN